MPVNYVSVDEAIAADGLRMVVVGNVPSPWGEAAKGILHVKNIPWKAIRLVYDNPKLDAWAGQQSGPVAIYNDEAPLDGWEDILLMAERISDAQSLLPDDKDAALELSRHIIGNKGLAWWRRLQLVHFGLMDKGGFPKQVAQYLGDKYGYSAQMGEDAMSTTIDLLSQLVDQLKAQKAAGSDYYFGSSVSAPDIYCATTMALFAPLPEDQCGMNPNTRAAFNTSDTTTDAALDPILLEHRDMMYNRHLELPLSL